MAHRGNPWAFCKFCGDQPGGCIVCVEHQAARAQLQIQQAQLQEMQNEAIRCLKALLNPGWQEGDPIRLPSSEIVDIVRDAFRWKRLQELEEAARRSSMKLHESPIVETRRRFEAIEWETDPVKPIEPEAPTETRCPIEI